MIANGIPWILYSILFAIVVLIALTYHFYNDLFKSVKFQIYVLISTVLFSSIMYTLMKTLQSVDTNMTIGYIIQGIGTVAIFVGLYFVNSEKNIIKIILYSSLVNTGLVFINLGLNNYIGLYSSLMYILKSVLVYLFAFIIGENICLNYKTDKITDIRGVLFDNSFLGLLIFIFIFNLTSLPPFALFFSEMKIIYNMFAVKNYFLSAVLIIKNIIFTYIIFKKFIPLLYGTRRVAEKKRDIIFSTCLIVFLLISIVISSLFMPAKFIKIFNNGASILLGDL